MSEEIKLNKPGAKPENRLQDSENTFFFENREDSGSGVSGKSPAQAYFDAKYPESQAYIVGELDFSMLHDRHSIIVLTRPFGATPLSHSVYDHTAKNSYRTERVRVEDVIGEVRESAPIHVKDYFTKASYRGGMGTLDRAGLYQALASAASPARPRPGSSDNKVILTYV